MKTEAEINELKAQWRQDPCWDIENTEGFEEHADDLRVYCLNHRRGTVHELKTDPMPFRKSWHGHKPFEIRENDRRFKTVISWFSKRPPGVPKKWRKASRLFTPGQR